MPGTRHYRLLPLDGSDQKVTRSEKTLSSVAKICLHLIDRRFSIQGPEEQNLDRYKPALGPYGEDGLTMNMRWFICIGTTTIGRK